MFVRNFVLVLSFATAALSTTCSDHGLSSLPSIRLNKDLVPCDYDKADRPVKNHKNATNVVFTIIMKYLIYDQYSSTISIDSWIGSEWKDEHLQWIPSDYDGIKRVYISSNDIWTPDVSVYNRAAQSGDAKILDSTECEVSSDGNVLCVPPTRIDALCVADLKYYPFDTQKCSFEFGSWIYKGGEVDIELSTVNRNQFQPNGEWEIIDVNHVKHVFKYECCPDSIYQLIVVKFTIKRLSGSHTASIVIPALVSVILTLTSLWITPTNTDRLILCTVNLFTHFYNLQLVSSNVPIKGDQVPLLILFARDSLLLCFFTIVFTIILKKIVEKKSPPPKWVSSIVSFVLNCNVRKCGFLSYSTKRTKSFAGEENGGTRVINNADLYSHIQNWAVIAKILDRLCFIVYVIIYFVMIIKFTL